MARGGNIEIPVAVDTGGVEKSIKNGLIDPVEDAHEALEKLGNTDAGADLSRQMDKAQRATREETAELRDAREAAEKLGYAAKEAGSDAAKGMGKAKEGVSEFKNEAGQSGRESAASFSGGFDDVVDFVQETAANAFAGFGPIGAVAGVAIAAGIGAALQGAADAQEKLQEARDAAVDLASQLYENNGKLPMQEQVENLFQVLGRESKPNGPLQKLIDDYVDFGSVLDDVSDSARILGRDTDSMIRALQPGDIEATKRELEAVNEELDRYLSDRAGLVPVWDETRQSLEGAKRELEGVVKSQEEAHRYNEAIGEDAGRIDALAQAWVGATTNISDYFTEGENGVQEFDYSAYVTNLEAQIAAADEVKRELFGVPPEIRSEIERVYKEQGPVAADSYMDSFQAQAPEMQSRAIAALKQVSGPAGTAGATELVREFNRGYNTFVPPKMEIVAYVNDKAVRDWTPPMKKALVAYTAVAADKKNLGG